MRIDKEDRCAHETEKQLHHSMSNNLSRKEKCMTRKPYFCD